MSQFHLTRADYPTANKDQTVFGKSAEAAKAFVDEVAKRGARKNKDDAAAIQDMHDKCAKLAGGVHCAAKPQDGEDEEAMKARLADAQKRGARHSASDMEKLQQIHDACGALGAKCMAADLKDGD